MSPNYQEQHAEQVDAWIQRVAKGLSSEKLATLFGAAIHALWRRSSVTLSDVTLLVIFDRALINSREKFPVLSSLKFDGKGIRVDGLVSEVSQFTPSLLTQAYRCLIIEVMTIVGSLTANILTEPLYRELALITVEHASPQSARSIKESKKGGPDREES